MAEGRRAKEFIPSRAEGRTAKEFIRSPDVPRKANAAIIAFGILAAIIYVPVFATAQAAKPEIKSQSVLGIPAGRTTTVVLFGENLAPQSVAVKPPLAVKIVDAKTTDEKLKGKGSRQVTLEVTVPQTCPADTFELTLTQPDKSIAKTNLCVVANAAIEAQIKKPASSFATAMALPGPSCAVLGHLDGDAADLVRIDGKAGELWDISLLSSRAGSPLDPVLRVRDSHHLSVALSAGDKKKDRHIAFKVPSDGAYYVEITEAEARGGPDYNYRLTISRK